MTSSDDTTGPTKIVPLGQNRITDGGFGIHLMTEYWTLVGNLPEQTDSGGGSLPSSPKTYRPDHRRSVPGTPSTFDNRKG